MQMCSCTLFAWLKQPFAVWQCLCSNKFVQLAAGHQRHTTVALPCAVPYQAQLLCMHSTYCSAVFSTNHLHAQPLTAHLFQQHNACITQLCTSPAIIHQTLDPALTPCHLRRCPPHPTTRRPATHAQVRQVISAAALLASPSPLALLALAPWVLTIPAALLQAQPAMTLWGTTTLA